MAIKLIATDIDGTLIRLGNTKLSGEIFEIIRQLQDRGIIFAAASGRQYANLRSLFAPVAKDMLFICENGSNNIYKGQQLSISEIDRETAFDLIDDIQALGPDCEAIVSCPDAYRVMPKSDRVVQELLYGWRATLRVEHAKEDICDSIIKISLNMGGGLSSEIMDHMTERWKDKIAYIATSGPCWLDFQNACKGNALTQAAGSFGITRDEIMVFGDNFNDIEMLDAVTHSYAMEGSDPEVMSHAKYSCSSVEKCLREFLEGVNSFDN